MKWQVAKLCLLGTTGFSLVQGIGIEASRRFFLGQQTKVAPNPCTAAQVNCPLPSFGNGFCAAGVACDGPKRCCSNAAQCPDIHGYCFYPGLGSGEPHMTNINGEKFEINYVGTHSLVRIPGYGKMAGKTLELSSKVANFSHMKLISKCHPFYFNMFDIRGKMLGSAVRNLQVRRDSSGVSLDSIMMDSNQSVLNQSFNNHTALQSSRMFGAVKVSHKTKQERDLLVFEIQSSHKILVTVSWWTSKPEQPGLNIRVNGLSPKMETIGGLLGSDPHSDVSSDPGIQGCPKRQKIDDVRQFERLNVTKSERASSTSPQKHSVAEFKNMISVHDEAIHPDVGSDLV